jgi:hypothetical protein
MITETYQVETENEVYEVTNVTQEVEIASLIADLNNPIVAFKLYRVITTSTRDYMMEHLKVVAVFQDGSQLEGKGDQFSKGIENLKGNLASAFNHIQENI